MMRKVAMQYPNISLELQQLSAQRAEELFRKHQQDIFRNTDRLFAGLMFFQWIAGIIAAVVISPQTWNGQYSQIHLHVWAAVFLGGAISLFPIWLALTHSGEAFTRYTIAVAQMLMSALLVHLSGGRIETHFHIFGSLVILSFYRDWRVLIPATIVVALDHLIRGIYFPMSAYGVLTASPWRSVEHAAWVLFENVFLFHSCSRSMREMRAIAENTAELETTNQIIEEKVVERTAEVKASEERFRLLVDGVRDYAIFMLDPEGRIISWNEGARRIEGYNADEIIGHSVSRFYTAEDIENSKPEQDLLTAAEQGRFEDEAWNIRKDGTHFWANAVITALRDETGQLRGFSKVTRDITERKRVEDALQKAHHEMEERVIERTAELARANEELGLQKTILELQGEASMDGILVVSGSGEILSFNRRFLQMWELSDDIIDSRVDEAAISAVLNKVQEPEAFRNKVADLYEYPDKKSYDEILLRDGRIFDRYSAPVKGRDGVHFGRIWFFRDITERKQGEAAIHQAKEEADRANAAKSEFLSRMSHELRTPLNAILGFGQLLDSEQLDPLQKESVGYILKGGRHLLDLINEVLDIARVEAGRMELSVEPVDLIGTISESCALVRPLANERSIVLVEDMGEMASCHVLADQQRLKQVLLNLLSNAIKYNENGGQVIVNANQTNDGRIQISIRDTGLGIAEQDLDKLFIPFERLGAANSGIEGTGLGLALAQKLVIAMGGTLTVESVVNEGSVFSIHLPIAIDPMESLADLSAEVHEEQTLEITAQKYTLLVIEDNLSNFRLIELMLKNRPDIRLLSAMQGSVGLDLAKQHEPDLILLDLNLPDIHGKQVLADLQQMALTRNIPVVVVSADATESQIERISKAGARAYLTKPFNVIELMKIINENLRVDSLKNEVSLSAEAVLCS
jgi:PAS domain S-box-containing protein